MIIVLVDYLQTLSKTKGPETHGFKFGFPHHFDHTRKSHELPECPILMANSLNKKGENRLWIEQ